MSYNRHTSDNVGPKIYTYKSRGSATTPSQILSNDNLFSLSHFGYDSSNYISGVDITATATENYDISQNGTSYEIKTRDNGSSITTSKLKLDSDGVTINDAFVLPLISGLQDQVLTQNTSGFTSWNTPFLPYKYTYQTDVESTPILYDSNGNNEIVTDTQITIEKTGNFKCELNSQVALMGTLNTQLVKKLAEIVTILDDFTYVTHAAAFGSGETLSVGNYYTPGAGSMTGIITFSGSATDVFVIYCGGAMAVAAAAQINFLGGALPENVFIYAYGAFSIGASALLSGNLISFAAMSLGAGCIIQKGRLFATGGAIAFGADAKVDAITDNSLSVIDLGILSICMLFSSAGAISRTGTAPIFGDVRTNDGTISGFGEPWDGTYSPANQNPIVKVRIGLYTNSTLNVLSQRIMENQINDFENLSLTCFLDISSNDVIDLRAEVLSSETIVSFKTRSLSAILQYEE
jgi:hypothetical protein